MRDQILEQLHDHGPKTVHQIADNLQADVFDVSAAAVELIGEGVIRLEPLDGTLWYAEPIE